MPDFRINPLQLPDSVRATPLDFRPLSEIGDVVALNRRRQQIADTLAGATDPSGNLDIDRAGTELAKIGLLDEARPVLALAQQKAALAQATRHQMATEDISRGNLELARRQYESPKPTVHSAYNPNTGQMEFFETQPGQPVRNLTQLGQPPVPAPQPTPQSQPAPLAQPPGAPTPNIEPKPAVAPRSAAPGQFNEAALEGLSPARAELVRRVASGEVNPASLSTRGGEREFIMGRAAQYDPRFDQTFYSTKQQTLNAFNKGVEGRTVRAVNNLVDHLETADELVRALGGSDIGLIRAAQTKWKQLTGQEAPTNLAAAAPIIGGEITKVIAGAGAGGVLERAENAAKALGTATGQQQAIDALGVIRSLMAPQLQSLQRQYEIGTRKEDFRDRLSPKAQKLLTEYEGRGSPPAAAPAAAAAQPTAPRTVTNAQEAAAVQEQVRAKVRQLIDQGADPKEALAAGNARLRELKAPPIAGP